MTSRDDIDPPKWVYPRAASYNSLKKGFTALLDRIGAKPYSRATISTPRA
jgi:hypothetical protein